jgi:hypothetical protein
MANTAIKGGTSEEEGIGYFLTKLWAKIKATFYTKTETDTKLNSKQATISGGASTITSSNLTASRALISNSSGKVAVSDVTSTELGYLDGVTSNVQTQLNAKAATSSLTDGSVTKVGTATKGSSTQPIYLSSGSPTTCSTYAGGTKVTLNGTDKGASTASFYAPTTVGTNYYILTSNGSGAPSWSNTISPDSIELYRGGSTSAGHGGYIDFHYNASTEDFTARIIEYSTDIRVMGKLMIQAGTLYLGANQSYTVTNTDNKYFIRSDAGNTITVPAGSGIPNRNLYILSMVAGSTLVYHTYRVNDFAMGDVSLIMRPGKVYHLIAYDENTWYLMNDVDNDHNTRGLSVAASSTLADIYVTNIDLASGITLTLPSSQAVQDRELMIYNSHTGTSPQIKYQVPAGASTYSTMTLEPFHCIKFIALSGYWYPMVNAQIS